MNQFWNKTIQRLTPYIPGEQPQDQQYIKLNTNENPIPPPLLVRKAMYAAIDSGLNLYPDPNCHNLKQSIAQLYSVPNEWIFVGNGSDEVLAHIFAGLFNPDKPLLCPDVSYSFYPVYARLYDLKLQTIPVNERFEIELDKYPVDNGGVIFANPNAPTSLALGIDKIEQFVQTNQASTIVIDEAYVDFGGQSCLPLIKQYKNVLLVQTLSKSRSLAGLRVGFALGPPELIEGLERLKNSFNSYPIDKIALAGAQAAIEDVVGFEAAVTQIIRLRDQVQAQLCQLDFEVLDSATNFVFARSRLMPAEALYVALKKEGILVRHFKAPRTKDYLRISIGTEQEMATFIKHLKKIFMLIG